MAGDVDGFVPNIQVHGPTDTVNITGTRYADTATISYLNNGTDDPSDDKVRIAVTTSGETRQTVLNRFDLHGRPNVTQLNFRGGYRNDKVFNYTDIAMEAWGGEGDDLLRGGSGEDILWGEEGNDSLFGGLGENWLYGGRDDDSIYGGGEIDRIYGESGNDWLVGNGGNDSIRGMSGHDTIFGNNGDDWIDGGSGNDDIYGGAGEDEIFGQSGSDYIRGGPSNDLILGGSAGDWLYGDAGNDTVLGESGEDRIYGGGGHDFLYGGKHEDKMYGGSGDDLMFGGDHSDNIDGQTGDDILFGGDLDGIKLREANYGDPSVGIRAAQDWDADHLYVGQGNDTVYYLDNTYWTRDDRLWGTGNDSFTAIDYDGEDGWGLEFDIYGRFSPEFWGQFGHLRD